MHRSTALLWLLTTACCATPVGIAQEAPVTVAAEADLPVRPVNTQQYRAHIQQLETLVSKCSVHPAPAACDPGQVGPDEEVKLPGGARRVGYAWLRSALKSAADSGTPSAKEKAKPDASALLGAAAVRLSEDAGALSARSPSAGDAPRDPREQLAAILRQRQFQHLKAERGWLEKAQQAFWQWVFGRLGRIATLSSRAPWLGHLLLWLVILVPCALLLRWVLMQSRRQRAELRPESAADPAAPSAREWQVWIAEAEQFAREQRWREAVHHVYWAAISRMEARGLWRADRARTPREYLYLLPRGNPLSQDLRVLTRRFEHVWYGRRSAGEREYREACSLMERLAPK